MVKMGVPHLVTNCPYIQNKINVTESEYFEEAIWSFKERKIPALIRLFNTFKNVPVPTL